MALENIFVHDANHKASESFTEMKAETFYRNVMCMKEILRTQKLFSPLFTKLMDQRLVFRCKNTEIRWED